jgi:hypothetical protein
MPKKSEAPCLHEEQEFVPQKRLKSGETAKRRAHHETVLLSYRISFSPINDIQNLPFAMVNYSRVIFDRFILTAHNRDEKQPVHERRYHYLD